MGGSEKRREKWIMSTLSIQMMIRLAQAHAEQPPAEYL